jgi:hypothetical protein
MATHDEVPANPLYEEAVQGGPPVVPYYHPSHHLALVLHLPHCGPRGNLPPKDFLQRPLVDSARCYQQLEWLQEHFGLEDAEVVQLLLAEPGYRSQRLQQLYGEEVGWWLVQEMTVQEEQLQQRLDLERGERPALSVAEARRLPAEELQQLRQWRERQLRAEGRQPPAFRSPAVDLWYVAPPRQVFTGALLRLLALQLAVESPAAPPKLQRLMALQPRLVEVSAASPAFGEYHRSYGNRETPVEGSQDYQDYQDYRNGGG